MLACPDLSRLRIGVLIAGLAGNNGSSLWAIHKLRTSGFKHFEVYGSSCMYGDIPLANGLRVGLRDMLHLADLPGALEDIHIISGWDTKTDLTLRDALQGNAVVPKDAIERLTSHCHECEVPIPAGVVYPEFIGLECKEQRRGKTRQEDIQSLANDIDLFAAKHALHFVVVVYSGSTESNSTSENGAGASHTYARAAATCKTSTSFINAAAQSTLTPSVLSLFNANQRIALGNDLLTGQTRLKYALLGTFLPQGLPVRTIVNMNTLGNRDGLNLVAHATNASKIASKEVAVEGQLKKCAPSLYQNEMSQKTDQYVHIAYVSTIGDKKRAMDEYIFETPFQQHLNMNVNSVCPDTPLALGVLTDLILVSVIMHFTRFSNNQSISCEIANTICASLLKNPVSKQARMYFQESRDVFTGFLAEVCGQVPETARHKPLFCSSRL